MSELAKVAALATSNTIERAITTVKETLGMHVVFVARSTEDQVIFAPSKGMPKPLGGKKTWACLSATPSVNG